MSLPATTNVVHWRKDKPRTLLGLNIEARRRELGLTVVDLARKAGMDRRSIQRIGYGELGVKLETLSALAAALECQTWELLKPGTFANDRT